MLLALLCVVALAIVGGEVPDVVSGSTIRRRRWIYVLLLTIGVALGVFVWLILRRSR